MLSLKQFLVLAVHMTLQAPGSAAFDFPAFDWFHPNDKNDGQKEVGFGSKPVRPTGQEMEEFHFGPNPDQPTGQEVEDFHFGPQPDRPRGQEVEEISFGHKPQHPTGQEVEEINFGHKPEHPRGQEMEDFHFGSQPDHPRGQEVEEISFGHKPDHPTGQEMEEINFGPKPHHPTGQEVEEINFGHKPKHPTGQEIEDFHFGPDPEHPKGQEIEEINFGPKPHHPKGQEVEEINFGHKPDHPTGQEMEEINFGPKPHHPKGQEVEEINFGPKPHHPTGQEVEEINFGHNPDHPTGQEIEEINFGPKPHHPTGQQVEDFHFGPQPDHPKGQEVEEINFGHKPDHPTGQEIEEFHFGPDPDHPKGQEIEEISFGPKPHHPKGQEVEEINFGHKPDHPTGQEIEEIKFGPKPHHPTGQEVEEINFGHKPEHPTGQEVEEINFGHKPEHPTGQEIEEIKFGPKPHHPTGQEVEEINFGHKPHHPADPDVHGDTTGREPGHGKDLTFGHDPNPKPETAEGPEDTGHWFDAFLPEITESGCTDKPDLPPSSILKCESNRICKLVCDEGFHFPDGTERVEFVCDGHRWIPSANVTVCKPVCEPPCQNNGECVAPNQCACGKNFDGARCEIGHKPCLNHPPVSHNSYVNCNSSNCVVTCFDNYSFPDGSSTANLVCHQGQWSLTREDWETLPECKPSCQPPCMNGGSCLDFNKCQCPRQYVGPQCQFELAVCDARKLNFNGYYTCRGENDKVTCTLSCPEGHDSLAPLAKEYVCYYSSGKFFPQPVPKCDYGKNTEVLKFASSSHTVQGGFDGFTSNQVPHHPVAHSKAECSSWRRSHYKNFDGKVFSFDSGCSYILAQDVVRNTFRIITENINCETSCIRSLKIFYQNQEYKLHYDGKTPILTVNEETIQIPNQFTGISVEKMADRILLSLQDIDVTVNWNAEDHVTVTVSENMWNKTGGLCGNFNGNTEDDFYTSDGTPSWNLEAFLQSWVDDVYNCESTPNTRGNCTEESVGYCNEVFGDVHFEKCLSVEKFKLYKEACTWDMCKCGKSCACETVSEFVRSCKNYLVSEGFPDTTSDWRQIADCPLNCPPGKVYSPCGPSFQATCGSFGVNDALIKYSECVEGCFCPEGLVQSNDSCVKKQYCPCKWRNRYYEKGEKITKDCNTCTCQNGEWVCTNLKCSSRCSVVGNSHYRTFDGKRYDLPGQCAYHLLKSESYSIESEDLPCEGNFANEIFHSAISKYSSCSKLVTIRHKTDELKLKKNMEVLLNGAEVPSLPLQINGIIVRSASLFVIVKLPDDTEVWWDGNANVYIDLPGNHTKSTWGLCGTFNNNQRDDFKTSEGDIEQTTEHFAEKWKTDETCEEVIDPLRPHPCDSNIDFKVVAEKHCMKLKGSVFKDCHPHVDVEPFYKNCLYDMCSCQKEIKHCLCPIFSDYVSECIRQSVELPWRNEIRECGLHCPQGEIYQPHGDTCARSCQDISITRGHCNQKYAEGCGCPDGLVLDSVGRCIPVSDCPCFHQNFKYKSNHELIMEGDNGHQFCKCQNALWSCRPATKLEVDRDYENGDVKCERAHEEYTTCMPAEPKTCKNMHEKVKHSTRICFPGCVCKKGFVWDSIGERCVNASECPCHHGGRSYADGEKIEQDCNSCTCNNGKWSCTERECPSVCGTWGDSHFKTFDGRIYDFQGSCDFLLAAGTISEYETFFISLQIVPCGSTGISCPKSLTLKVGSPQKEEKVVFRKSNQFSPPSGLERILIREVGLFIFAEVFDLGLTVQWDKGTRVYVKADSRWKNRVNGLCGNFNDDELDDFKTPSSGETSEISPVLFADSWRLQTYCPESNPITDACARLPHRKPWAVRKCSILHSETFEPCHSEVPLEPYFERCVGDTCGCDEGGDCDCMCTAVAAYAEECTMKGVPIKWRTQELCPLQCHDHLTYNPCVSTCPPKSCDNQYQHSALLGTCSEDSCVEGCDKLHCPPGHVLADSSSDLCVPVSSCKTVCLMVNNTTYLEGDLMESDDCHSCYCSHHAKVCIGKPCPEVTTTSTSPPTTTSACPPGHVWDDCIVKCDHVCNHLVHNIDTELHCSEEGNCISGCRAIELNCTHGMFLRDMYTCVQKKDCPCISASGLFLKPGDVVQESECEKCQCINNEYECSNVCTVPVPATTPESSYNFTRKRYTASTSWDYLQQGNVTLIYYTTITPSALCPSRMYESLIDKFTRFSSSSHLDASSAPVFGEMSTKGTWTAGANNADQYLQVDLGRVETVHAVNVAGASGNYVTAYHLLHSLNGEKFLDVFGHDGRKEVFGGPFDGHHPVKQVLPIPIEARYIRFHPTSWHGQISMKVDVLGCRDYVTPTTPPPTLVPSICNKPIGIGQKYYPKLQIVATSSKPNHGPEFVGFDNENGWRPLINSKFEFLQIDFGDHGNFTGVTTKGVSEGNDLSSLAEESWVERYKVEYSHDGLSWNPVLDEFGDEMTFMGNTDGETEKKNFFKRPIHAKALKVLPVKWHKNIALRLDVMGCYEPSRLEVEVTPPAPVPTPECNVCTGVVIEKKECKCKEEEWWDGENCVGHSECPCFVGLIAYPVGSTFTTENCEECTCRLYGLPHCTPKLCPDCPDGLQKVLTPLCGCTCKPCEEHTRLCPTSNICLHESSWCDGIQDCPDDELNCTVPTTIKAITTPAPCLASCPPGYEIIYRNVTAGPTEAEDMLQTKRVKSVKTKKSVKTYRKSKKVRKAQKLSECPPYDCVPIKEVTPTACPTPECPLDYTVAYKQHKGELEGACPLYTCEPLPEFADCTVLSKNIRTFDGSEYKYEICDHVLVTHDSALWNITMVKNCTYTSGCTTILLIHHGKHLLEIQSHNSLVKLDSFPYTSDQMELLNSKMENFTLNRIGNYIIFTSNLYGFELIYDTSGNLKIKVPGYMKGHLAGLCGLYNGNAADDKTLPDGKLAKTTVDFGNAWFNPGGKECIETVCPLEMQKSALETCLKLKEKPFNLCSQEANMELCVEWTCECLVSGKSVDECRCQLMSDFATKCQNANLFGWRVEHDCPSSCPPNLVHHDCYPYTCQPTCGNEECTEPAANCYSGCFCPDGLVKRGEQCIKVAECRDCVCSGMGDSTYLTFDGGLTFNGNCTYVATRDKNPSGAPTFEVLISNSLCSGSDFMTCTDKVEVKVPGHSIKIVALPGTAEMVKVLVDDLKQDLRLAEHLDRSWAKIGFYPETSSVHVGLPKEHVDVRYFYKRSAFTISLPSHLYSDRVEGLCGACSQQTVDPEEVSNPELWQTEKDASCLIEPPIPCVPTAEHIKICEIMNDPTVFGQCLAFVDPAPFVDQCLALMCLNGHVCTSLEAYGQACRDAGVCVEWRSRDFCPFTCPSDLEYQACNGGCPKTCDNYDEIEFVCTSTPVEGCFCPDNQILINGTCKPEKYCESCDEEGNHYEGDLWQVDRCTNCSCKNRVITCDKIECLAADITCDHDQIIIREESALECCPKYKCGCKHPDDCPPTEIPHELPPGMEAVVDDTGCCRKVDIVCRKENCPAPTPCKEYYHQKVVNTSNCCPDYFCEKPDDICFYEFDETSPSEKPRVERGVKVVVVKEVGERWSDGPCKSCVCVQKIGYSEAVCVVKECPNLGDHHEFTEYHLEEVFHPDKCCPEVVRRACKHNGREYKVGDSWVPDENNPCETMKCNSWGDGIIMKDTRLEVCNTDCDLGWEYERAAGSCCGHCVQKGCLADGKVFREGEVWYSDDNCSASTCAMMNGHFSITTERKTCPSVEDCPREDIYRDGCCLKCRIRAEDKRVCFPQPVPAESTVGLIRKKIGRHGKCRNVHPVENFARCAGNCDSYTEYNPDTWAHENVCKCCKPEEFTIMEVELKCEDGAEVKKKVTVPSKCSCMHCGG